jgi:hypothetical protein
MKKLTVIVALALLAVGGTGYAVTCAYDNVPGATLLIPYFRVSGTVDPGGQIDVSSGTDTKVSFVNVSWPGIIAHVTIWNKYSAPVLDFNVPMTGKDVVSFSMKDILNGHLNVNPLTQVKPTSDVCGINLSNGTYNATPYVGWGQSNYLRFPHPKSGDASEPDWQVSISKYAEPDAFSAFRAQVLNGLDESGDITSLQSSSGANILDTINPQCGVNSGDATLSSVSGDFSGYITVDVVNYCTNWFPNQLEFYVNDAVATAGWGLYGYTPNCLIGDVFYVDGTANTGNISGDPAIALEFDSYLNAGLFFFGPSQTFFGRFVDSTVAAVSPTFDCEWDLGTASPCGAQTSSPGVPAPFRFGGDGREPLGDHYGFRYLSDATNGLRTWIEVWRGDIVQNDPDGVASGFPTADLCAWLADGGPKGYGFYDLNHQITFETWDNDEGNYSVPTVGNPSGYQPPPPPKDYVFLEAERISLYQNTQIIPGYTTAGAFNGGWIDFLMRDPNYIGFDTDGDSGFYNQGWVGVQHTGPGTLLNVGYGATSLYGDYTCGWIFGTGGVVVTPVFD